MFKLLKFGVKAGLTLTPVYLTIDYGVWKDSETTNKLYNDLSTEVKKYAQPYIEKVPLPDIPATGSAIGTAQNTWNAAVKSTSKFLAASPVCAFGYIKKGYKYVDEQIREGLAATNSPPSA